MEDPADIDGDGKFVCVDISIMEDDKQSNYDLKKNSDYCMILFVLGSVVGAFGWFGVIRFLS